MLLPFCIRGCGCNWRPAFPAPSALRGTTSMHHPDANRAAGTRRCTSSSLRATRLRSLHKLRRAGSPPAGACAGGSEAIQTIGAGTIWLASSLSLLAMTNGCLTFEAGRAGTRSPSTLRLAELRGARSRAAGGPPPSLLHSDREAVSRVRSHISPGPYRSFRELSLAGSVDPDIWCPPTFVGNSGIERFNGVCGFAL